MQTERNFHNLAGLSLMSALSAQGITVPTDIQAQSIPLILQGRDVIASSRTGTGKTLAYLLPLCQKTDLSVKTPGAVVLLPTHELASQVFKQARHLYGFLPGVPEPMLAIGGASISRQLEKLKQKPRMVIGSAGRIVELIRMKKLSMHTVKTIVLDEFDRLLDEPNLPDVQAVIKSTLRDRQLLFFSASMQNEALQKALSLSQSPEIVQSDADHALPDAIEHMAFICLGREKIEILRKLTHNGPIERGIVFLNDPNAIEILTKRLNYHGIPAAALFGAALKNERKAALESFREGRIRLLVSSDLAARGLDIPGVTHIVNMDVPEDPVVYLHRIGRTARMHHSGTAVSIATEREIPFLKKIEKEFRITIAIKTFRYGKIYATHKGE